MTDLIRSASLTHYAEIARSVGIDPRAMLKQARLPLHCLENPDLRIAVSGVRRLLEASAEAAGVEEFGLRLADRGGFSTLGPVALVVREQATVGAAMEALARYIQIQNEAMRLEIDRRDDLVTIAMFLRGGPQRATAAVEGIGAGPDSPADRPRCCRTTGGRWRFIWRMRHRSAGPITENSSAAR